MKHHSPRQQEKRNFLKTNPANFPPDKGGLRGLEKEADCRSHSASLHSLAMTVGLVALSFVFSVGIFGGTSWAAPSSISVESVPTYTAGSGVSANQFNLLTGTIRGIYNYLNNNNLHFFGINTKPLAGIGLNIEGSLQLGKVAGNSLCNLNLAGSLYFNTENKRFWYCNGTNWRELDKKVGRKYTCIDDGDGLTPGIWNGGTLTCNPVDYDKSGHTFYDWDLAGGLQTVICADRVPDNSLCKKPFHASICEPKNLAYETRCYDADNNGKKDVWQFDDCGNKVGFSAMATCTLGCTETQVTPKQPLPNGSGLSPMHPQYTSGAACATKGELGCDTGANWADPYAADDYKYIGDSSFYDSPRDPNTKFAGFCDEAVSCGAAESVATSVKPVSSGLCDAGTPSAVVDGWTSNPKDSNWHWTCGARPCEAPHREWIISPWGDCASNGKQSRGIYCYRHN